MLIEYSGEGAQAQAAKLLEVIILQYQGQMKDVSSTIINLVNANFICLDCSWLCKVLEAPMWHRLFGWIIKKLTVWKEKAD